MVYVFNAQQTRQWLTVSAVAMPDSSSLAKFANHARQTAIKFQQVNVYASRTT